MGPTELRSTFLEKKDAQKNVVGPTGFEPVISSTSRKRHTELDHEPNSSFYIKDSLNKHYEGGANQLLENI